jgi:hypothetical protein
MDGPDLRVAHSASKTRIKRADGASSNPGYGLMKNDFKPVG